MAQQGDINPQQQQMDKEEEQRLKYLEFIQVATVHALLYVTKLYGYAKDKSGPLKPSVETVEGTVKSVVGPVYHKFHGVPIHLLKYVDRQVDASVTELDRRVPPSVKQASSQALAAAQKAPEVARSVASAGVVDTASGLAKTVYTKCEPAAKGLYAKCEPAAKGLYAKYEPKAEQCAASAWRRLNQLPIFPRVANVVVPTAAFCSEKYNQTVTATAEKGYRVSSYLPLVPVERIARVFGENGVEGDVNVAVH